MSQLELFDSESFCFIILVYLPQGTITPDMNPNSIILFPYIMTAHKSSSFVRRQHSIWVIGRRRPHCQSKISITPHPISTRSPR